MKHDARSTSGHRLFKWYQWLFTGLILLFIWVGCFSALYVENQHNQQRESQALVQNFNRSLILLIEPMVLADDRVSLNYLFNELTDQQLIQGLRLTLPNGETIARAGNLQHAQQQRPVLHEGKPIAQLTVATQSITATGVASPLLWTFGGGLLALLLNIWLLIKLAALKTPRQRPDDSRPADQSFSTRLRQQLSSEAEEPEPVHLDTPITEDEAAPEPFFVNDDPDDPNPEQLLKTLNDSAEPTPPKEETASSPAPEDKSATVTGNSNRELIELLRPEHRPPLMPHFTPNEANTEVEADIEFEERTNSADVTPEPSEEEQERQQRIRAQLTGAHNEEQLDLYTLEHQLELILSPMEAGYLLLIDTNCSLSGNLEQSEREYLLRVYRTLANSVARIYNGAIEIRENGDIELLFTEAEADDSHGINALCSGVLFTQLYRQYNHSRLQQMKPVINLHTALVRGAHAKLERMYEEAHFLTRTTANNDLISHTALTEAPQLKQTLLTEADVRREDEDKVLILKLTPAYQSLLEKQARHLLIKLKEREQGSV